MREPPAARARPPGLLRTLVVANVQTSNRSHARALRVLSRDRPDVIVLIEATNTWIEAAGRLLGPTYRYRLLRPRPGGPGIAVFSRRPVAAVAGLPLSSPATRALGFVVTDPVAPLTVIALHPLPPTSTARRRLRDQALADAARWGPWLGRRYVVVGDLNALTWEDPFQELVEALSLTSASTEATWPAALGSLGVTLDHVLTGPGVHTVRGGVGPEIGSDHLPLFFELAVRPAAGR